MLNAVMNARISEVEITFAVHNIVLYMFDQDEPQYEVRTTRKYALTPPQLLRDIRLDSFPLPTFNEICANHKEKETMFFHDMDQTPKLVYDGRYYLLVEKDGGADILSVLDTQLVFLEEGKYKEPLYRLSLTLGVTHSSTVFNKDALNHKVEIINTESTSSLISGVEGKVKKSDEYGDDGEDLNDMLVGANNDVALGNIAKMLNFGTDEDIEEDRVLSDEEVDEVFSRRDKQKDFPLLKHMTDGDDKED